MFIATIGGLHADPYSFSPIIGRPGAAGALDGPADIARLNRPSVVARDAADNLYFYDAGSFTVRKATPTGAVTTLAGLAGSTGYVDARGAGARFTDVGAITVDPSGTIYLLDRVLATGRRALRKLTVDGDVSTLAPDYAFALEAASGLSGNRSELTGLATDAVGNIYIADRGYHVIRRVSPAGSVATYAGRIVVGQAPMLIGPSFVFGTPVNTNPVEPLGAYADGPAATARFNEPNSVALDASGNVYVADRDRIRKITPAGSVSTLLYRAAFGSIVSPAFARVAVDGRGNVYAQHYPYIFSDLANFERIGTDATVTFLGGPRSANGFVVEPAGRLIIAVPSSHAIYQGGVIPEVRASPLSQTANAGSTVTFTVSAESSEELAYQWNRDGIELSGATGPALTLSNVQPGDAGIYAVIVRGSTGAAAQSATLQVVVPLVLNTTALHVPTGGPAVLSVSAPAITGFEWRKNGVSIPGATSSSYVIPAAAAADMGFYSVVGTTASGARYESAVVILTVETGGTSRLANIAIRGHVARYEWLTAGFTVRSPREKMLIVRGVGPGLAAFGVPAALGECFLEVVPENSALPRLVSNAWDMYPPTAAFLSLAFARIGAFPLVPGSRDAALAFLPVTGSYTARLTGSGGASRTGVALVEVYDYDAPDPASRIVNLSALGQLATGGNSLVPGFVIDGVAPKRLLIRAIGPGLDRFNVVDGVKNPSLGLVPAGRTEAVVTNDDWDDSAATRAAFLQAGAFPLETGSRDAAMVVRLPPGAYTALVSDATKANGTVLIELYDLDP